MKPTSFPTCPGPRWSCSPLESLTSSRSGSSGHPMIWCSSWLADRDRREGPLRLAGARVGNLAPAKTEGGLAVVHMSTRDLAEERYVSVTTFKRDGTPASTEAQLRDTETGLSHYLRAFETGDTPAAICSPRVTELTERRDELIVHRERLTSQLREAAPQLPTREKLQALCTEIRRIVEVGNPDAVKQLLRELIDRVEITPDRRAYLYFWVPASCDPTPTTDERGPNAQPAPSHQEDAGWLFMTNRGGGGNRTRVLRLLNGPSPSAASGWFSGTVPPPAMHRSPADRRVPGRLIGRTVRVRPTWRRPRPARRAGAGRTGYRLGSQRELRLGVCFVFRLFYVAPETTARFSRIDDRSRNRSPPLVVPRLVVPGLVVPGWTLPWYRLAAAAGAAHLPWARSAAGRHP